MDPGCFREVLFDPELFDPAALQCEVDRQDLIQRDPKPQKYT